MTILRAVKSALLFTLLFFALPAAAALTCEGEWQSASLTNYESYPDPGSVECVQYNGCKWSGQFYGVRGKKSENWEALEPLRREIHTAAPRSPGDRREGARSVLRLGLQWLLHQKSRRRWLSHRHRETHDAALRLRFGRGAVPGLRLTRPRPLPSLGNSLCVRLRGE